MISNKDIPQDWKLVLAALQNDLFADAIIAGGALRDLDHDKPVSDVDIFMKDIGVLDVDYITSLIAPVFTKGPYSCEPMKVECVLDRERFLSGTLESLGDMCGKYVYGKDIDDTTHDEILRGVPFAFHKAMIESYIEKVFNIEVGTGDNKTKYQIITISKDPMQYVAEDFDFGLCKILYDGVSVIWDEEYEHDKNNKVMTFRISATKTSLWRSVQHHWTKLQRKYVGYPFQMTSFEERPIDKLPKLTDEQFEAFSSHAKAAKFNKPRPKSSAPIAPMPAVQTDSMGYII